MHTSSQPLCFLFCQVTPKSWRLSWTPSAAAFFQPPKRLWQYKRCSKRCWSFKPLPQTYDAESPANIGKSRKDKVTPQKKTKPMQAWNWFRRSSLKAGVAVESKSMCGFIISLRALAIRIIASVSIKKLKTTSPEGVCSPNCNLLAWPYPKSFKKNWGSLIFFMIILPYSGRGMFFHLEQFQECTANPKQKPTVDKEILHRWISIVCQSFFCFSHVLWQVFYMLHSCGGSIVGFFEALTFWHPMMSPTNSRTW